LGREEEAPNAGDFFVRDVGPESVIVTRGKDSMLRAFFNTCAHRGTKLCDTTDGDHFKSGVIKCPYHAWTFDLEGNVLGTPNVHEEEGFDRSKYPLHTIRVETWAGFVWVNMGGPDQPSLLSTLEADTDSPLQYERWHLENLRSGFQFTYEVESNWKILLENYNECLHCPSVHPELIAMIPIYKKGTVEQKQGWGGNSLVEGATTLTPTGQSNRPALPGLSEVDQHTYFGHHVFPNLLLNLHSDCAMYYLLLPRGPKHTTVISNFLFEPSTMAREDFDPHDIADFWDIVSLQDWEICERAQTGVVSRGYNNGGVYPWNDRLLVHFNERYLKERGPVES